MVVLERNRTGDVAVGGDRKMTRIQARNRKRILAAALDAFSSAGFAATTIETIASMAGMSKQNLLYYYPNKEALYIELLSSQMDSWQSALARINPNGDPVEELCRYAEVKISASQANPMECRLFAMEMLSGAPFFSEITTRPTKDIIDRANAVVTGWMDDGKIRRFDAAHLLFSIWSMAEQYAKYGGPMCQLMENPAAYPYLFEGARSFMRSFLESALKP